MIIKTHSLSIRLLIGFRAPSLYTRLFYIFLIVSVFDDGAMCNFCVHFCLFKIQKTIRFCSHRYLRATAKLQINIHRKLLIIVFAFWLFWNSFSFSFSKICAFTVRNYIHTFFAFRTTVKYYS